LYFFILIGFFQIIFFIYSTLENEKILERNIYKTTSIGFLGVKEKHRVLIESVLSSTISNFQADNALLCKEDELIASEGSSFIDCNEIFNRNKILNKIIILETPGESGYRFVFSFSRIILLKESIIFFIFVILLLTFVFFFVLSFRNRVEKDIILPFIESVSGNKSAIDNIKIEEIVKVFKLKEEIAENEKENLLSEALIAQSMQVSHDIRSPLAALKMAIEEVDQIHPDFRHLIRSSVQRINDIANNLLSTNKGKSIQDKSQLSVELLAPLVDSLISEKRMQYRNNNNIEIDFDLRESYGLFANINSTELSRVISNIINNSVEAIEGTGKITVNISVADNDILLTITDNGKGIPETVLAKLGEAGFSHGKTGTDSGNGLGIHHAKATVETFGGRFEVESTIGIGTVIKIYLPKQPVPKWFVESINITNDLPVYILDDDDSIHKLWSERFSRFQKSLKHFTNGEEFARDISKIKGSEFLCLADFELLGQSKNGLDIIEELQISKKSILVTSRFDESEIRNRAHSIGVRFIPKSFASLIPIINTTSETYFEIVYIDDDYLLRLGWERRAIKKNITLLTLTSCEEFQEHISKISKSKTKIYIDSSLGEGKMPGEEFAKLLNNRGYEHLYIASGYDASNFAHHPWLKFAGKECPF
jgi:signal transduction histidine kinase